MVTHFSLNPIRKPFTALVDTRTSNMYELCPTTFRIAYYAHTHTVFAGPFHNMLHSNHQILTMSTQIYLWKVIFKWPITFVRCANTFQHSFSIPPICNRYRASDRTMHSTYSLFSLVTNCSFKSITFTISHHSLQLEVIQDTLARALQSQTSSFQCVSLLLENVSNHIWPVHFAFVKCVCEAMKQYQVDG